MKMIRNKPRLLSSLWPLVIAVSFTWFTLDEAAEPVEWQFKLEKIDDLTYEFKAEAQISPEWRIGSLDNCGMWAPTIFQFCDSPFVFFRGSIRSSPEPVVYRHPTLAWRACYYEDHVVFSRTIRRIPYLPLIVKGEVTFQASTWKFRRKPQSIQFTVAAPE